MLIWKIGIPLLLALSGKSAYAVQKPDECIKECVCHDVDPTSEKIHIDGEGGPKTLKTATCMVGTEVDYTAFFESIGQHGIQVLSLIETSEHGSNATVRLTKDHFLKIKDILSLEITQGHSPDKDKERFHLEFDALTPLTNIQKIFFKGIKLHPNPDLIAWDGDDDYGHETDRKHKHLKEEAGGENHTEMTLDTIKAKLQFQEKLPPILPYDEYIRFVETHGKFSTFSNLTKLRSLKLIGVNIPHPNWEMISGLPNLKHLTMEKCGIKFLSPKFFSGTPALEKLSLADNDILGLDFQMFLGLGNLQYLDLSFNKIDHLSLLSFPYLPKVEQFKINGNPLTDVFPAAFMSLENLKSMQIGNPEVQVKFRERAFRGLEHLETLLIKNMASGSITVGTFESCKSLKDIAIGGRIDFIDYDSFTASSKTLETLALRNAGIKNVSMDGFYGLDRLKKLDLSWNLLNHMPHGVFDPLVNLRQLDLRGNKLEKLPENAFESLLRIESIKLEENPWNCDCYMALWRRTVLTKNSNVPVCHSPEIVKGEPIFKALKQMELNCTESPAAFKMRQKLKLKALPRYGKA